MAEILIDCDWLLDQRDNPALIILDASMAAPGAKPNPTAEICTIPNALRFDIDQQFSDPDSLFPHTLPSPEIFSQKAQALGISNDSHLVIFDNAGIYAAPRAWWMFRAMGHQQVSILNGGLPAWRAAGHECDDKYAKTITTGDFEAKFQDRWFVNINDVEQALDNQIVTVIDARSADRFHSRVDEPRPDLRRGNIPGSKNLPFANLLNENAYMPTEELRKQFAALHLDREQPLFFSCGSGVTACVDAVAALLCGYNMVSVYDGSWCEWGSKKS